MKTIAPASIEGQWGQDGNILDCTGLFAMVMCDASS